MERSKTQKDLTKAIWYVWYLWLTEEGVTVNMSEGIKETHLSRYLIESWLIGNRFMFYGSVGWDLY